MLLRVQLGQWSLHTVEGQVAGGEEGLGMAVGEVIDMHHGSAVGFLPGDHVDPFGNLLPLAFGFAAGASVRAGTMA
ncbi:hypothetical protein D3C77_605690 [compost metagenome]